MKTFRLPILFLLSLSLCLASCGKKLHLNVSQNELNFNYNGGMQILSVTSNSDWIVDIDENIDWIHATPIVGNNNGEIAITVDTNRFNHDRSAVIGVITGNGKIQCFIHINQQHIDINELIDKVWFLYAYERWNIDYYGDYIEESYRQWEYHTNGPDTNWFFYFREDSLGFEIYAHQYDTIYYPFHYVYYAEGDSLYINFVTENDETEDYHATIPLLNADRFQIQNEYRWHQFEKLYMGNVTVSRNAFEINPKKLRKKPKGALIQVYQ